MQCVLYTRIRRINGAVGIRHRKQQAIAGCTQHSYSSIITCICTLFQFVEQLGRDKVYIIHIIIDISLSESILLWIKIHIGNNSIGNKYYVASAIEIVVSYLILHIIYINITRNVNPEEYFTSSIEYLLYGRP